MENKKLLLEIKKNNIRTNHILHSILTLLTGVWGIVWIIQTFRNQTKVKDEKILSSENIKKIEKLDTLLINKLTKMRGD